jgi:hypothetical protein
MIPRSTGSAIRAVQEIVAAVVLTDYTLVCHGTATF